MTVTKPAGTGIYKAAVTLPALTAGQVVAIHVTATVNAVAGAGIVFQDVADTARVSDVADQVWDESLAGHMAAGSAGKALGDGVTVNASVAISSTEAENVASGRLAIRSYHSFSQVIESTSTAALNTATKLWLVIKTDPDDADSAALVLIEKTAGLTVLAGAAYTSTTQGSLAVAGSAGDWEITAALDEVAAGLLHSYATAGLYAECKALVGTATIPVWDGTAAISKGIVRARCLTR